MTISTGRVIGVDACKKGWVGITSDQRGYFGESIRQLIQAAQEEGVVEVVAIDIPIGLPTSGQRQADLLARKVIGRRASSVFTTPTRAVLSAGTHAEATALSVKTTGKGISQQSYALARKIMEVDQWLRSNETPCVAEVHPEVCFAAMARRPLAFAKSTWAGVEERRSALASVGMRPGDLGWVGGMAAVDDVLDAAAACWTARRYAMGNAISYPDPPEEFEGEPPAAIWA